MRPEDAIRDGKLDEALAELKKKVQANPADAKLRTFLFQIFAVQGDWERALNQLSVAGDLDAETLAMVQTYREAIACEAFRAEVFAGKRSPLIFGEPEEWLANLVEAQRLVAEKKFTEAASLRERAFEAAPTSAGTAEYRVPGVKEPSTAEFAWLADADVRLGPVLEAVINGRYYWVPMHRVSRIDFEKPADLRDVVWMPVHFEWKNGGEVVGLIPTRYAESQGNPDPLIRLARKTDWAEPAEGCYLGQGQRMLASDAGEWALMDLVRLRFAADEETGAA